MVRFVIVTKRIACLNRVFLKMSSSDYIFICVLYLVRKQMSIPGLNFIDLF